jgi:uncharacterized protein YdaU (DUF1376 family)
LNFYKHHLGDYAAATSHLSWDEDCAYRRLIDQYYKRETPIPAEMKDACRLARATTPAQRRAVQAVLEEFFSLHEDGWHQKRCDEEIGAANAQAETNKRIAAEREAKRRARIENESLHEKRNESNNESSTNRSPATMVEREPSQTPDSISQTPDLIQERATTPDVARASPQEPEGHTPTPAGLACRAMKAKGLSQVNPGDPRLTALLDQGATVDEFAGIAEEAVAKSKGFAWVLTVLQNRRAEAAQIALAPRPALAPAADWTAKRSTVIERACRLGIGPWNESAAINGVGPSWADYRANVIAADKRQGATA